MVGGFSRPKKDRQVKVSEGQKVKTSQILVRGCPVYKAGFNVKGLGALHAQCCGEVYFTKRKTSHGKFRTFVNVRPEGSKPL